MFGVVVDRQSDCFDQRKASRLPRMRQHFGCSHTKAARLIERR